MTDVFNPSRLAKLLNLASRPANANEELVAFRKAVDYCAKHGKALGDIALVVETDVFFEFSQLPQRHFVQMLADRDIMLADKDAKLSQLEAELVATSSRLEAEMRAEPPRSTLVARIAELEAMLVDAEAARNEPDFRVLTNEVPSLASAEAKVKLDESSEAASLDVIKRARPDRNRDAAVKTRPSQNRVAADKIAEEVKRGPAVAEKWGKAKLRYLAYLYRLGETPRSISQQLSHWFGATITPKCVREQLAMARAFGR